jgi:hypothetical protein
LTERRRSLRAGSWPSAEQAAVARDRAALYLKLDVPLNFPDHAAELGPASPFELRKLARVARKHTAGKPAYLGVSSATGAVSGGYIAQIYVRGHTHSLGRFETAERAALAHDRAVVQYFGRHAPRNFPDRHVEPASIERLRRERGEERRRDPDHRGVRTSRYKGVQSCPGGDWAPVVRVGARRYLRLGTWSSERAAALARDRAVLFYGLDDELNFPGQSRNFGKASPEELRLMGRSERRVRRRESTYVGVGRQKGRWVARVQVNGKSHVLRFFDTAKQAALFRERAIVYYGSSSTSALRNFPEQRVAPASLAELERECSRLRKRLRRTSSRHFGVIGKDDKAPIGRPWQAHYRPPHARVAEALGFWETEDQAAEAVDRALLYYQGPARLLNFPERRAHLVPADAETLRLESRLKFFKANTSSRFRGVTWSNDQKAWRAGIRHENQIIGLGYFADECAAARAYDRMSLEFRGTRAWLNFDPVSGAELLGKRIGLPQGRANLETRVSGKRRRASAKAAPSRARAAARRRSP